MDIIPDMKIYQGGKYHMNIKKKLGILLIVIIAVSGLVGYYRVSYAGNLEAVTEGISESIIRFLVRANSDSQEDLEVKL